MLGAQCSRKPIDSVQRGGGVIKLRKNYNQKFCTQSYFCYAKPKNVQLSLPYGLDSKKLKKSFKYALCIKCIHL